MVKDAIARTRSTFDMWTEEILREEERERSHHNEYSTEHLHFYHPYSASCTPADGLSVLLRCQLQVVRLVERILLMNSGCVLIYVLPAGLLMVSVAKKDG